VVGIDRLDSSSPRLEGVWLFLYLPEIPKLTMIPLYPSLQGGASSNDSVLEKNFHLTNEKRLDPVFVSSLRSLDLWWNSSIVLDETTLAEVIERLSGVSTNGQPINGIRAVAKLPLAWEKPQEAIRAQAALLAGLCKKENKPNTPLDVIGLFDKFSNHLSSDIDAGQLLQDWKSMSASGNSVNCEFPTMDQTTASHKRHPASLEAER